MTFEETKQLVKDLNISDNEEDIVFKAAVYMLYSITNRTVGVNRIKKETGYSWKEVWFLDNNFRANNILHGHRWNVYLGEDFLHDVVEIACCALAAAGQLMVYCETTYIRRTIYLYEDYFK